MTWLIAKTPIMESYPCRCRRDPCAYAHCPCLGRTDGECTIKHAAKTEPATWSTRQPRRTATDDPVEGCPLCGDKHDGCHFAVGSSYCIQTDCDNPHHRSRE